MRWCLLAVCLVFAVRAQEPPRRHDFLLVVDTSIAMAEHKNSLLSTIRDLVQRGFAGQIQEGDRLGIWTFDSLSPTNRHPVEVWDPEQKKEIAEWAVQTVRDEKFRRGSRLSPVLENVNEFATQSPAALILILTEADEPLTSLQIGPDINSQIAKLRQTARRTRKPVMISLTAVDGKFADWRAYAGSDTPRVPRLPERPKVQAVVQKELAPATVAAQVIPEPEKEILPPPAPVTLNYPPGAKLAPTPEPPITATAVVEPPAENRPISTATSLPAPTNRSTPPLITVQATPPPAVLQAPKPPPPAAVQASRQSAPPNAAPVVAQTEITNARLAETTAQTRSKLPKPIPTDPPALPRMAKMEPWTVNWTYVGLGIGGISFFAVGLSLMNRGKPATKASLISRSLVR